MLNIDSIQSGIVIDHIKAGTGMQLYNLLNLGELDCCVALIKNARSEKYGRKDIIKIEGDIEEELAPDLEILGYLDPNITICFIRVGRIAEKKQLTLPKNTAAVAALAETLRPLLREMGVEELFDGIEMPLCKVLAEMECRGFLVDREALRHYGESLNAGIERVVIRDTPTEYRVIRVQDWIEDDDSLSGVFGY